MDNRIMTKHDGKYYKTLHSRDLDVAGVFCFLITIQTTALLIYCDDNKQFIFNP